MMTHPELVSDLYFTPQPGRKAPENQVRIDGRNYKVVVQRWGYEQTNVDFYAVIKETPKTVTLRRIGSTLVSVNERSMSGHKMPTPYWHKHYTKTVRRRKANKDGEPLSCNGANGSGWCSEWDGAPQRVSWGH